MKLNFEKLTKLLYGALVCLAAFVLFIISVAMMQTAGLDMSATSTVRWIQVLQNVVLFALPTFFCAWIISKRPFDFLRLMTLPKTHIWLLVAAFAIVILPGINLLIDLNEQLRLPAFLSGVEAWMKLREAAAADLTQSLLQSSSIGGIVINLAVMALLPALGEELLFRGGIQRFLERHVNPHLAIWITAIVFSAIHFQFYGFIPRMLLGAAFGYMALWTGSLWMPILAHFMNNAIAVVVSTLQQNAVMTSYADTMGSGSEWWLGFASLAVAFAIIMQLRKTNLSENRKNFGT